MYAHQATRDSSPQVVLIETMILQGLAQCKSMHAIAEDIVTVISAPIDRERAIAGPKAYPAA